VLLTRTVATVGLDRALSEALARWRRPFPRHDPGKIVLDVAGQPWRWAGLPVDVAQLRAHPQGVRSGRLA
jgi:hypothetical protein